MSHEACRSGAGISSVSKGEEGKRLEGWAGGSSFFRQLYITMAVAILTLAIVASVTMSWQADRQGSANLIEQGIQAANNLASRSQLALIYHEPSNASDAINIALAGADVMAVEIRQEHGELLFYKPKTRAGIVPTPPQSELPPERLTELREGFLDGETADAWVFVAPVLVGASADAQELMEVTTPQVLGYVRIVKSKATMARMRSEIYAVNFAVSILVAGVLLVIVRILSQQLIRPLTRLSKVMTAAEGGRTDVRAQPTGPNDIREMAKIFNQMMDVLETREKELRAARDEAVRVAQERVELAQAEQERLEAMVAERTKTLNELLETRGQIVSNASHELRTPVNALRLLVDATTHLGGTERRASVQKIDAIVEHMSRLVENLLLLNAGPERSIQRGVVQPFDLGAEIRATGNMLESIQQASAVKFELDVTACEGLWVQGDLTSYRQILINVLTNAFKFTEQGRVGLKAVVSTDPERQMVHCTVTIADTGHGLPAEQHDRIFEPFVTTRSHSGHTGTGLGLPISRQLAREMGGDLRLLRSIENVGSEFECDVWFDAVTLNEAQQGQSSSPGCDQYAPRLRVLLAEDDPITADAMAIIIGHLNHDLVRVATVADLETELAADPPYDVALIDNRLPGGRGLDVIRKVRMAGSVPRTKLVLLSAETGSIAVAAREVCDAVLTKPTGANTIQQLLGTAAPRDDAVARILDPAPLVMLQNCGATESQLREMWDTFVVMVAKEIGTIQQLQPFAGHAATEERLWEILHPLGSACSTIGAVALGKAFQALRQCRTKSDAEEQLKRIQAILEATQVEFEEQLFAAGEK